MTGLADPIRRHSQETPLYLIGKMLPRDTLMQGETRNLPQKIMGNNLAQSQLLTQPIGQQPYRRAPSFGIYD
jgi:hypothetical protein